MPSLQLAESMSAVSARMVEAARANDWDRLVELGGELAALREELARLEPGGQQAGTLTEAQSRRKAELIERMLTDEREIQAHVRPWMDGVRELLSAGTRGRRLRAAYGAALL